MTTATPTKEEAFETLFRLRGEEILRMEEQKDKLLECLPATWLDPLLLGKDKALHGKSGTWGCNDIERLLSGIKQRFEKVINPPEEKDNESTESKD